MDWVSGKSSELLRKIELGKYYMDVRMVPMRLNESCE